MRDLKNLQATVDVLLTDYNQEKKVQSFVIRDNVNGYVFFKGELPMEKEDSAKAAELVHEMYCKWYSVAGRKIILNYYLDLNNASE